MNRIWISFPLEENADATSFYNRARAFGFDAPEPKNPDLLPDGHPNRDAYFVPLLLQDIWGLSLEKQAKLITGHANTLPPPEFILRPPPASPPDPYNLITLGEWVLGRDGTPPATEQILSNFVESMKTIASISSRVSRMTAAEQAQVVYDNWDQGDQGIRRKSFVVNKNPKPTYWLEVGDEGMAGNLSESGRQSVVFGSSLLVRFSGVPTEEEKAAILKLVKTVPSSTRRSAPT